MNFQSLIQNDKTNAWEPLTHGDMQVLPPRNSDLLQIIKADLFLQRCSSGSGQPEFIESDKA